MFPVGCRFQGPGPPAGGVQKAEMGGKHPRTLIWYLGDSQETLTGACSLDVAENAWRETTGSSGHVARVSSGSSCHCPPSTATPHHTWPPSVYNVADGSCAPCAKHTLDSRRLMTGEGATACSSSVCEFLVET